MKSYTDLEQSKKLAEILSIESVDMHYEDDISVELGYGWHPQHTPCWSLAALFNELPLEIFNGEYIINITEGLNNKWCITYDNIANKNHSLYGLTSSADNLVDACYEMINKLKEWNLL